MKKRIGKIKKKVKRTKKPYNLDSKIVITLRRVWQYHPVKAKVYARNLIKKGLTSETNIYKCEICPLISYRSGFNVDHIEPATELSGRKDWNSYIYRLLEFPLINEFSCQLLCKSCHNKKTLKERQIRKTLTKK